jgi:tripartite-type tricarboxylate transporter receptor subunit TctC
VEATLNRRAVLALLGTAPVLLPRMTWAQGQFPDHPIRLIVPYSAGGVVDVVGRIWAEHMRAQLGTIVVENQGGGGGVIGAAEVARAQPDGYTMLLGNTSTQVVNPQVMARPPYDPAKAFAAVSIIAISAVAIAVHPAVPAKTLPELIAHIKANPGKLSYGSPGTGTLTNLAGEIFKQLADTPDLVHVPYKGSAPGVSDLIAGHIPTMVLNITNQTLELHRTGKIRIIAVCTPKRLDVLPDVAVAADTLPNLIAQLFTGLFVPAATPKPIIDRVAEANRAAMSGDALKTKLLESGFEPVLDTPAEAQRFVDEELARLTPLIKSTGFVAG